MPRHPILRRPPDSRQHPTRSRPDFQTPPPRNAADIMQAQLGQSPIPYETGIAIDARRVAAIARFEAVQVEDTDRIDTEEVGDEVDEELEMGPEGQMEHDVDGEGEVEGEREIGEEDEEFEGQEEDEDEEMRDRSEYFCAFVLPACFSITWLSLWGC